MATVIGVLLAIVVAVVVFKLLVAGLGSLVAGLIAVVLLCLFLLVVREHDGRIP